MPQIQRRALLTSIAAVGMLPVVMRAPNASAQDLTKVIVAVSNPGAMYMPYYVADKAGIAKEEGLELPSIMIASGIGTRDALVAGRVQFAAGQGYVPAQLVAKDRPVKIVALCSTNAPNGNLVIRKDLYDQGINTVEKFAAWKRPDGSKPLVVATSRGSGSYMLGAITFESFGVADKFGWIFAEGGGASQVLALLKSKQVDAMIANPNWQGSAETEGFGTLLYDILLPTSTEKVFGGPFMNAVFYGLDSTLKNRDMTQRFVNSIYRSMQWIKNHSEDEAWNLLQGSYFSQLDAAVTKKEMSVFKRVWNYDCMVSAEMYERSRRLFRNPVFDSPDMEYDKVVDMSFVEAARKKFG